MILEAHQERVHEKEGKNSFWKGEGECGSYFAGADALSPSTGFPSRGCVHIISYGFIYKRRYAHSYIYIQHHA